MRPNRYRVPLNLRTLYALEPDGTAREVTRLDDESRAIATMAMHYGLGQYRLSTFWLQINHFLLRHGERRPQVEQLAPY